MVGTCTANGRDKYGIWMGHVKQIDGSCTAYGWVRYSKGMGHEQKMGGGGHAQQMDGTRAENGGKTCTKNGSDTHRK
jgi:hypothetical protein